MNIVAIIDSGTKERTLKEACTDVSVILKAYLCLLNILLNVQLIIINIKMRVIFVRHG
jgi:hypothetical protein